MLDVGRPDSYDYEREGAEINYPEGLKENIIDGVNDSVASDSMSGTFD